LFKDPKELYNMVMFVDNARTRKISDSTISDNLKSKGWASEQIRFIIRRSRGKSTGLPEIIPFSKISAFMRKVKAEKEKSLESNNLNGMRPPIDPRAGPSYGAKGFGGATGFR
jgi:hypothetical protein